MEESAAAPNDINGILDDCFSCIIREFETSVNLPGGIESLIKEVYHRHIHKWQMVWTSSHECSYPGCNQPTNISSHTIQKAGPLRFISEGGHVLSPRVNKSTGKLTMERIGLNDASTFVGFCETHERIFTYEQNKTIVSDSDFTLQIFRTVCRELKLLQLQTLSFKEAISLYKKRATAELIARAMERLGEAFFRKHGIRKVAFQFDVENGITTLLRETFEQCQRRYDRVLRTFYEAFQEGPDRRLTAPQLQTFVLTLPLEVPVALAGRSGFTVLENDAEIGVDFILNINPCVGVTHCFITCSLNNGSLLERLLAMFGPDIKRLSLIENWMLFGSDHWFIRPSVWLRLPPERQEKLCNLIRDSDDHIGTQCQFSIFDAARRILLNELRSGLRGMTDEDFIMGIIAEESAKLA